MLGSRSILVVLAHPDDESFPMGGTLAKHATQGSRITLLCATRGEAGIPGLDPQETGRLRERELRAAAEVLGVSEVRFLDYQDGKLASVDRELAISRLIRIMHDLHPEVVVTFGPDGISGHPDHVSVHEWTTAAFDQASVANSRLYYIAPSEATLQGCGVFPSEEVAGGPVAAIDVGAFRESKVRAMQCHASQSPPFSGPPKEEASRLTCHEYFTLARPTMHNTALTDLFEAMSYSVPQDVTLTS